MNYKMWNFNVDCGRMGELDGLFIETEEKVKSLVGKEIYFGEVLGKHSEIAVDFDMTDVTLLDVSEQTVVEMLALMGPTLAGFNPFDYYEEYEEEEKEE